MNKKFIKVNFGYSINCRFTNIAKGEKIAKFIKNYKMKLMDLKIFFKKN